MGTRIEHNLCMAIMQHQPEAMVRALKQGARLDGGPDHNPKLLTPGQQMIYSAMTLGSSRLLEAAEQHGEQLAPHLEGLSMTHLVSNCRKSTVVLRMLLERWPNDDWRKPLDQGNTLLHAMVNVHSGRHVKTLVGLGLDVNAVNAHGQTPLHLAQSRLAIAALLALGARRGALDNAGNTRLQGAIKKLMNVPRRQSGMKSLTDNDLGPVWLLARNGGLAEDPKARTLARQLDRLWDLGLRELPQFPLDDIWQQVQDLTAGVRRDALMAVVVERDRQVGRTRRM